MKHNMLIVRDVPFLLQRKIIANKEFTTLRGILKYIEDYNYEMYKQTSENIKKVEVKTKSMEISVEYVPLKYKIFSFDCNKSLVKEFLHDAINHMEYESGFFIPGHYVDNNKISNSRHESITGGFKVVTYCEVLDLKKNKDENLLCDLVISLPCNEIDDKYFSAIDIEGHIRYESNMMQRYKTYYKERPVSKILGF